MRYEDLLDHPHHVSEKHPAMSLRERAAQFSPFAALTGHSAAIQETARLTEEERHLDENRLQELNEQLTLLESRLSERPVITIRYYLPDEKKEGGSYRCIQGVLRRIDRHNRELSLEDGIRILLDHVADIEIDG